MIELHPPPPPTPPKRLPKRKSISIQYNEFKEWKYLKQKGESWTALMRRIRMGLDDLKNININVSGVVGAAPIERVRTPAVIEQDSEKFSLNKEIIKELKQNFGQGKSVLKPIDPKVLEERKERFPKRVIEIEGRLK